MFVWRGKWTTQKRNGLSSMRLWSSSLWPSKMILSVLFRSFLRRIDGSVPVPSFDLCVAHKNIAHFGMLLELSQHLERNNLHTNISSSYASELYLQILFHLVSLFHLMCCQHWPQFTRNICVLYLDSKHKYVDMRLLYCVCAISL